MNKAEREERRARMSGHRIKWRDAEKIRRHLTLDELAEEESRLEAEIAARVAAGLVTICAPTFAGWE